MRLHTLGLTVAVAITLAPAPALAQSEFLKDNVTKIVRKVGIHASTSFSDPLDTKETQRDGSYGVSIGLAPGRSNGWRYPVGLAWFTEELKAPNGSIFSQLRSRPIVAGIGYGWHFGKLSTGASLQAGWAFNTLKPHGDIETAFATVPSAVAMDVSNSFVMRPQVKVEYFVTEKFTVRSSLNYIFENPMVTVRTPQGVISDRWNASNVTLSVGVGYYPFRK